MIFDWPLTAKWVPIWRAFGDTNSSDCPRSRPNKLLEGVLEGMRNHSFFQGCSGRAPPLEDVMPRFRMSGHIGLQAEIKRKIVQRHRSSEHANIVRRVKVCSIHNVDKNQL